MGTQFKRVHVIINPASGDNEPILNMLNDEFHEADIQWDVSVTHAFGDAERFAQEAAARQDTDLVIAYGGDGTVMEVVNGIWQSGHPMAILPGGTGNAVAQEFGVATSLQKAIQQICAGTGAMKKVDMGRVDDGVFLLRSDVGVSELLDQEADREAKDRYGIFAYLIGMVKAFPRAEKTVYRLTIDGEEIEYEGTACIVVNMGSIGTFDLGFGDQVQYDDGLLNVFLANNDLMTALEVAASAARLTSLENVLCHYKGKQIRIETEPVRKYSCDGERMGDTPYQVEVLPGALNLFVPAVEEVQIEG